jgi:hypothetical protein
MYEGKKDEGYQAVAASAKKREEVVK